MEAERAKRIKELQKEKDVVILAHYYVDGAVQEIADYVGDSFYLSKVATKVPQKTILFAGVTFMGESAKILNPDKTVVMADECADCPMAHMITADRIAEVRAEYEDLAVVCYVNSTAEIKAVSDVCVTSSNAVKVVSNIPQKNIFFVPDNNLGRYVAEKLPEKHFIFHDGFCHVHKSIHAAELQAAKDACPEALVLTPRSVPRMWLRCPILWEARRRSLILRRRATAKSSSSARRWAYSLSCSRRIRTRSSTRWDTDSSART